MTSSEPLVLLPATTEAAPSYADAAPLRSGIETEHPIGGCEHGTLAVDTVDRVQRVDTLTAFADTHRQDESRSNSTLWLVWNETSHVALGFWRVSGSSCSSFRVPAKWTPSTVLAEASAAANASW
eukprot:m51a1_g8638 hypothetical protein (125) ;mRNA; f:168100-170521